MLPKIFGFELWVNKDILFVGQSSSLHAKPRSIAASWRELTCSEAPDMTEGHVNASIEPSEHKIITSFDRTHGSIVWKTAGTVGRDALDNITACRTEEYS